MSRRLFSLVLQLIIFPSLLKSYKKEFIQSNVYYKAPSFSIKNTNVTFGVTRAILLSDVAGESVSVQGFSETLTSICQAELINQKKAQVAIDGKINLVFQDYSDPGSSGEDAILNLLSNNLFFYANGSRVNQNYAVNLTGFFSVSSFGTAKINSIATNDFGLPFITSGDLGRASADNQFSGSFPALNVTFAQVLNTYEFNSFNAVLQILNHFNWTLVGNLFQANTYGYSCQQNVLYYASKNSLPIFTCGFVYGVPVITGRDQNRIIDDFCRCIQSKDYIDVVVLWMSTSGAFFAIQSIRDRCSVSKKLTFIVADDLQSPVNFAADKSIFNNSLLLRNNGPWNYKAFLQNCQEYASPEAKSVITSLIKDFYSNVYKCKVDVEEGIPACPESIEERLSLCKCTLNEISQDPYITKFFYTADAINVYAAAISLLQNNCTLLNERRDTNYFPEELPDFCSITSFGPIELSFAIRFVNFTGYTGPISFPKDFLVRNTKSFYLYSVFNNSFDATLVGYINETGTTIYNDLITFVNNEVPVSEIVPQNPDLSYAVVDVFFGVAIVELIICLGLLIFLISNRNDRVIRQCAPLVTIVMLLGVTGLALAQIFLSFARTNTWCAINLYLFRISLNLILMSLLVKNYRIYKIFSNKRATAVIITESTLLAYIGIMTLFYIIVLTVVVAVFGCDAVVKQSKSNPFYQYVQCSLSSKTWSQIVQITLDVIIFIQVIASLTLAWLTRKVQAEYRESRGLAAFATIVFVSLLIFIPLNYTLGDETNSQILRYVIVVEFFTVKIVSAIALLFVPIVITVQYKRDNSNIRSSNIRSRNVRNI